MTLTKEDLQAIGDLIDVKMDEKFEINNAGLEARLEAKLGEKLNKRFDELDVTLAECFRDIQKQFDGVNERFAIIEDRFDAVDARFDRLEERVDGISYGLREVKDLTAKTFNKTVAIENDLSDIYDTQKDHENRIVRLEKLPV